MSRVSIITPYYQAFDTIDETVKSVLEQTYQDWELIICNDNGQSGSDFLSGRYSDPRIKIVENENGQGAASARNTALSFAKGKYITFLDSDDIWSKEKLSVQTGFMEKNSVYFSYGSYSIFNNNHYESEGEFTPPDTLSFEDLVRNCPIGCLTVMVDREKVGEFLFPNIKKEDYALWLLLAKKGFRAHKYPGNYAYYRVGHSSLSSNKLKELKRQFIVLRKIGKLNVFQATYYAFTYSLNGIKKHLFTYKKRS